MRTAAAQRCMTGVQTPACSRLCQAEYVSEGASQQPPEYSLETASTAGEQAYRSNQGPGRTRWAGGA